ncbi:MAG: hypothetical protein WC409_07265, partial [Candidatus Omnitrophota bacterium]
LSVRPQKAECSPVCSRVREKCYRGIRLRIRDKYAVSWLWMMKSRGERRQRCYCASGPREKKLTRC